MAILLSNCIAVLLATLTSVFCCPSDVGNEIIPEAKMSTCGHNMYYNQYDWPGVGIVGGVEALPNEFPWTVRLTDISGHSFCAATIIDEDWLLTAAHCMEGEWSIIAHFADHYQYYSYDPGEFSISVDVSSSVVHPNYDRFTNDYDFALLKLSSSLNFADWKIQKICLPTNCYDKCSEHNHPAFIHGWGNIYEGGPASYSLQSAMVYIKGAAYCQEDYYLLYAITENMVCAGVYGGGIDGCNGDSGGPMVINEDGYFKLCGISSYGYGCARAEYPGVYARVCKALSWIHYYIDR